MTARVHAWIIIVLTLFLAGQAHAGGRGHVAVFYLLPDGAEDDDELVEAIEKWLDSRGVARSFHRTVPFEVTLLSGKRLEFSKEAEDAGLGFVLIRPDGTYELLGGVYTDVGFVHTAKEFFGFE